MRAADHKAVRAMVAGALHPQRTVACRKCGAVLVVSQHTVSSQCAPRCPLDDDKKRGGAVMAARACGTCQWCRFTLALLGRAYLSLCTNPQEVR